MQERDSPCVRCRAAQHTNGAQPDRVQRQSQACALGSGASSIRVAARFRFEARIQKRQGLSRVRRTSLAVTLDKPLYSLGLAFQMTALAALIVLPPVFVLSYGAVCMVLLGSGYEMLARHYSAVNAAREGMPSTKANTSDESDDYLNRGLGDVFFPWRG